MPPIYWWGSCQGAWSPLIVAGAHVPENTLPLSVAGLTCAVLIFVAFEDAGRFRIRNGAILLLLMLFAWGSLVSGSLQDALWHGVFALLALALMFGAFLLRFVGAGDAKLMAVACLWIGSENAALFALFLLGFTALYGLGAGLRLLPTRRDERGTKIPFGPSIALAWIAVITLA